MSDTDYPGAPMGSLADQSAMMPETYVNPLVDQTIRHVAQIPQRAIETAAHYQQTGEYNPGPILDAAMLGMTGGIGATSEGGVALGSGPIRAYHSSPHDFEKFDLSKIGTGEGAQVYGHGIYAAESPKVSGQGGQYWDSFRHRFDDVERSAANQLRAAGFDREMAIAASKKNIDELLHEQQHGIQDPDPLARTLGTAYHDTLLKQRQAEHELLTSGNPVGPRTYELDIHADPAHLLNWDKPLTEQSHVWGRIDPKVKGAIDDMLEEKGINTMSDAPEAYTGSDLHRALKHYDVNEMLPDELPGSSWLTGATNEAKHTAAYLNSLDIPGVKYLDQGSRGRGGGMTSAGMKLNPPPSTHNYAIWRPDIIQIMRKYGLAGAAPVGMGTLAAQDQFSPSTEE